MVIFSLCFVLLFMKLSGRNGFYARLCLDISEYAWIPEMLEDFYQYNTELTTKSSYDYLRMCFYVDSFSSFVSTVQKTC